MTDPLLNDLSRHLHERMQKVIEDYFARIQWSGKQYTRDQLSTHLTAVTLSIAATCCKAQTKTTLDEFIKAAYAAYQIPD